MCALVEGGGGHGSLERNVRNNRSKILLMGSKYLARYPCLKN